MLGDLSAKYESNGDAGCISDGWGDPGGKSYGAYQLSSNAGSLQEFLQWLDTSPYSWLGMELSGFEPTSAAFDDVWKGLARKYPADFFRAQHDYIKYAYYDPAVYNLAEIGWHIENHTAVMKDVVWSRAVQYGPGQIAEMWTLACQRMWNEVAGDYAGYPNVTYIDAARFDYDLIASIYLRVCKTPEWAVASLRDSLYNRFDEECREALARV